MMQPNQAHVRSRLGLKVDKAQLPQDDAGLAAWLAEMQANPAAWLYLRITDSDSVPAAALQAITQAGIQPIVHLPLPLGDSSPTHLNPKLRQLAGAGVRHVIVHDNPNMKQAWTGAGWQQQSLTERFLDRMTPVLQASHSAGLVPTLPPLRPGGDYWDLAFLEAVLRGVARRLPAGVLSELTLAVYLHSHGKPADWGKGGPQAWPQARPYFTPPGHQDHLGLSLPEWYEAIAQTALRRSLPQLGIVSAQAGPVDNSSDAVFQDLFKRIANEQAMPQLLAVCFEQLPALPSLPAATTAKQPTQPTPAPTGPVSIDHYLLLPEDQQQSIRLWRQVSAFAIRSRATVGFSSREAARATKVTLAGGPDLLPTALEAKLRLSGCQVDRVTDWPQSTAAVDVLTAVESNVDGEVGS